MSRCPGLNIQHALSGRGEYRVPSTNYRADGYCVDNNTIYEYLGCLWHGCPVCHPDRHRTLPKTNETADLLYTQTEKRLAEIKRLGYDVVTIWEHEFHQQLSEDTMLRDFAANLDIESRLSLRDAFFGGRTNATKLHYEAKSGEKIKYVDFTSLYPYTNKYSRYPIGHPEIITDDFSDISSYFGMAKIKILPPRGLYHPVLPHRANGKLTFPLCRTCASNENQRRCMCTDEQRVLVGTWCTPEIEKAVECGYKIIKMYEVYHWPESSQYDPVTCSGGLFADFINTFLKIKQESSGWPAWCVNDELKMKYVEDYHTHEGIQLDVKNIKKNPGRRTLAKLLLNR